MISRGLRGSNGWLDWLHLDTADTVAILDSESDVSLVAPGWAPGVLDEIVLSAIQNTVADSEDTVVELGSASLGEDTRSVLLEDPLVSLDGDGDWSLVEGSLELVGASWSDHRERGGRDNTPGAVV